MLALLANLAYFLEMASKKLERSEILESFISICEIFAHALEASKEGKSKSRPVSEPLLIQIKKVTDKWENHRSKSEKKYQRKAHVIDIDKLQKFYTAICDGSLSKEKHDLVSILFVILASDGDVNPGEPTEVQREYLAKFIASKDKIKDEGGPLKYAAEQVGGHHGGSQSTMMNKRWSKKAKKEILEDKEFPYERELFTLLMGDRYVLGLVENILRKTKPAKQKAVSKPRHKSHK